MTKPNPRRTRKRYTFSLALMERLGLVPPDTEFNRRAAEYARGAEAIARAVAYQQRLKGSSTTRKG